MKNWLNTDHVDKCFLDKGMNFKSIDIVESMNAHFALHFNRYISIGVFGSILSNKWVNGCSDVDISILVDTADSLDSYIFKDDLEGELQLKYQQTFHLTFLDAKKFHREILPAVKSSVIAIADFEKYYNYISYYYYLRSVERQGEFAGV